MSTQIKMAFDSLPQVFTQKQFIKSLKRFNREKGHKSTMQHLKSQGVVRVIGYQTFEKTLAPCI